MSFTAAAMERVLVLLAPLFLEVPGGDVAAARDAARASLADYAARTDRELRLAALAIAFGLGALEALSRSQDPALTVPQATRLRANANALGRAVVQAEVRLDKLRKQVPSAEPDTAVGSATGEELPASSRTDDLVAFVRSSMKSLMGGPRKPAQTEAQPAAATDAPAPRSRQQRRAEGRRAEKAQRRQQQVARLAERAAARAARQPEAAMAV